MALVKGTNSFATVEEFDAYCADRVDMATDASAENKAQALVSATDMLNELRWTGVAISETQLLAFPRVGTYFDPRVGRPMKMDPTPMRIQTACMELAYHLLVNDSLKDSTGSVENIEIGPIKLVDVKSAPLIPLYIKQIFRPILVNQGASSWWRAN